MMMNKIRSIKQLEAEKKRIKQHRQKLEDKLRSEWHELKDCLKPVNIAKDTLGSILKNRTESNFNYEHILKSSFTYGLSLLAGRFAESAKSCGQTRPIADNGTNDGKALNRRVEIVKNN